MLFNSKIFVIERSKTRRPNYHFLFSSAPGLLVFFALISSNIVVQFILIMIPGVYALITFASGLKQVYMLRNIEVVLLLVALIFSGAILGPM